MYTATSMLAKSRGNAIYGTIQNSGRNYYRNIYLNSEHWKNLRREKLEKSPVCEQCGTMFSLDIHHKEYRRLYDVTLKELQTLCRVCHNKEHRGEKTKWNKKNPNKKKDIW